MDSTGLRELPTSGRNKKRLKYFKFSNGGQTLKTTGTNTAFYSNRMPFMDRADFLSRQI